MTLYIETIDEPVRFTTIVEEDDWTLLESFISYAEDLLSSQLVQNGMPASLKIGWRQGEPMIVESTLPPKEVFLAFLHLLRPIYLQSEATNFYRICSLLSKNFEDQHFRRMISDLRDLYSGKFLQSMFQISSNNVAINSDKTLNDWLNSYEYHRDTDKRDRIDALHEMFPLDASKVIFLSLLTEKVKAIAGLASIVNLVLGKQKSLSTKISSIGSSESKG